MQTANEWNNKRILKATSFHYEKLVNQHGSIEKHYGLTDKRFKIKRIPINIGEDVFEMTFVRRGQSYPLSKTLNKYILREINEFANEIICVKVKCKHKENHPFKPPTWSLQETESNIMSNIGIYFEYVLNEHFIILEEQWSPSISYSQHLLMIIVKILDGYKYILTSNNKIMYSPSEVPRISDLLC
tara:strand:+ start:68 stop:625 length:558 start_codon:yes stop_codon:yes gene_type:complete